MAEIENAPGPASVEVDALVGRVLNDRFKVLERIGAGGMGRVYKALQAPLDRLVALKVLNPNYAIDQDPAFAKRFFLEASVSSKLTHPNSITIFDYGRSEDGIFYIAMEFLQGRTLHQVIAAEGCLVAPRAVHVARQICRALREAHGLGIVHRDLKPANVMLLHHGDDEDFVKVLDFGLVKFFTDKPDRRPEESELTQGGVFLGSPTYMAPEQARNQADPRSDVYSLGVMLYHMLAGRPPFQGKAAVDIILKHCQEPPPPFRPELKVPPDLDAVVMRSLEKEPEARYQSMDEFLEALKRLGTLSPSDIMMSSSLPFPPSKPGPPISTSGRGSGPKNASRQPTPLAPGVARPLGKSAPFHLSADEELTDPSSRIRFGGPLLAVGALGLAVALGVGGVLLFRGSAPKPVIVSAPAPIPAVVPPPPPIPEPGPIERSLHVESVPAGATVSWRGKVLGLTPLDVRVDASEGPPALELSADGFVPTRLTADVQGDAWIAHAQLERVLKPVPAPNLPPSKGGHTKKKGGSGSAPPSGYKDDPYK